MQKVAIKLENVMKLFETVKLGDLEKFVYTLIKENKIPSNYKEVSITLDDTGKVTMRLFPMSEKSFLLDYIVLEDAKIVVKDYEILATPQNFFDTIYSVPKGKDEYRHEIIESNAETQPFFDLMNQTESSTMRVYVDGVYVCLELLLFTRNKVERLEVQKQVLPKTNCGD